MVRKYIERQTAYGKIRKYIGHCVFCDNYKHHRCAISDKFIEDPQSRPDDCPSPEEES